MRADGGTFSVSYDRTARIVTAITIIIVLLPVAATRNAGIALVSLAVIVCAYAFSPRGYAIVDGSIIVKRMIGRPRVSLEDVREVRVAQPDDFHGCVRLLGSGGLFGYYGMFRTQKLGRSTWYVTDRSKAVVVVAGGKTAVFSPDDADGFVAAVRKFQTTAVSPAAGAAMFSSFEPGRGRGAAAWLAGIVGVGALVFATMAMLYSPGPPQVDLTAGGMTIHDRFHTVAVNADAVDVARVRVIDLETDTGWRPQWKVRGFSNPYYRSGLFRAANGQTVGFYAGRSNVLVLLPPKGTGTPVLLQSPEPERLVAEVHKDWGDRP